MNRQRCTNAGGWSPLSIASVIKGCFSPTVHLRPLLTFQKNKIKKGNRQHNFLITHLYKGNKNCFNEHTSNSSLIRCPVDFESENWTYMEREELSLFCVLRLSLRRDRRISACCVFTATRPLPYCQGGMLLGGVSCTAPSLWEGGFISRNRFRCCPPTSCSSHLTGLRRRLLRLPRSKKTCRKLSMAMIWCILRFLPHLSVIKLKKTKHLKPTFTF